MKRVAISTMHLYGLGGGARAVAWLARAFISLGWRVDIFTSTAVPEQVRAWLPRGVGMAATYPVCGRGYDLLFNIDHFNYAAPLADRNWAHIFQPHNRNRPPGGFELWANSKYTAAQIQEQWQLPAKYIYIPISDGFRPLRKQRWITHCSRIVKPTPYADKGHRQMISAFIQGHESGALQGWEFHIMGSVDPGMEAYLEHLVNITKGFPVYIHLSASDDEVVYYLGCSPIYWHMTGITMPEIPGAQEHLGLTPLEAMAAGAIPICHATGGPLETIEHGKTGFLVTSTGDLLKATAALAQNLSLWSAMSDQAKRAGSAWQDFPAFVGRVEAMLDGEASSVPTMPSRVSQFTEGDVTIVVPVYNNWALTERFLRSLNTTARPGAVVLIDNGSTDETAAVAPNVEGLTYVRLEENKGFAGAIFKVLSQVETPLVLIANNDLECLDPNWLAFLAGLMAPDVGIVGPKLIYPDGRLQFAGGVFDWNRPEIGRHRWYGALDHPAASMIERVPFITGACLLARKELLLGTPEGFLKGLNYEDAHWCLTAWEQGFDVMYAPCVRLIHYEAQTKRATDWTKEAIYGSRDLFADLWGQKWLADPKLARLRALNVTLLGQEG